MLSLLPVDGPEEELATVPQQLVRRFLGITSELILKENEFVGGRQFRQKEHGQR